MAVTKKTVLKQARKHLEEMKTQLLSEIRQDLREGREGTKDEGRDAYDIASEERDREIHMLLSDRERNKLQAIEDALDRIEEGTYATCDNCEGDIHPERLKVMPFTRLCVECQSELEQEAGQTRRSDDSIGLRRLGPIDLDEENSQ